MEIHVISIFPDIQTWLLVWAECSVSGSMKISITPTFQSLCGNSGGAGTFHYQLGSETMYIFPWVEAEFLRSESTLIF